MFRSFTVGVIAIALGAIACRLTPRGNEPVPSGAGALAVVDGEERICAGTLIASNLVLTARHCVAGGGGDSYVDCARDGFAPPRASPALKVAVAGAMLPVAEIIVPTATRFCGNDLALLVLRANVPSDTLKPVAPLLTAGDAELLVAGRFSPGDSGSGLYEQARIVGVLSRIDAERGAFTRTGPHADFLREGAREAAAIGATDAPAWARRL